VLPRAAWLVAPVALTALATAWAAPEATQVWTPRAAAVAAPAWVGYQGTWTYPEPLALPACLEHPPWALRLERR